jgi:hypothetical protein
MYMTLPCPNCGEDLEVHVHAMVHIEKWEWLFIRDTWVSVGGLIINNVQLLY